MSVAVPLPELGESVVEGTVARWLVKEGEAVRMDQPLVEVTTDKVDAEIPAPVAGTVEKILVPEGETVSVGTELARIAEGASAEAGEATASGEAAGAEPEAAREEAESEPAAAPTQPAAPAPSSSGAGERADREQPSAAEDRERPAAADRERPAATADRERPAATADRERPAATADRERPRATPVAERVAASGRVDLREVRGTGVGGRITKDDVVGHAASRPAPGAAGREPGRGPAREAPPPAREEPAARPAPARRSEPAREAEGVASAPPRSFGISEAARARFGSYELQEGDRVTPMSPLRRLVAEHMVYSKHVSPHVGTVAEVDLGGVAAVRSAQKRAFQEAQGFALTFLPFIVHATVRALREFPQLNASVIEDAIVEKRDIHVGIAVETDKGLIVPVLRHADRLSLAGIAAGVEDLSSRARNKKLSADELKGGTFTLSNPGRRGNLYGFAIINQPQVGILRMGEIVKRPVVREADGQDAIVIRPMMHLALSYDHRAVDGAPANSFLYRVRELLEEAEFDL